MVYSVAYPLSNSYFRQNRSIRPPTGKYWWATGRIFCTPSLPVHTTFTFMVKKRARTDFLNILTVHCSALLLRMPKIDASSSSSSSFLLCRAAFDATLSQFGNSKRRQRVRLFSAATSLFFSLRRTRHNANYVAEYTISPTRAIIG